MSSANKLNFSNFDTLHTSLTYIVNHSGPKTEHCGTPDCFGKCSESKRQYAQFMSTKSTPLRHSVSKMAQSIEFRWLCVLHFVSGKPLTYKI